MQNKLFIRFQTVLGLAALAAMGFFAWNHLGGLGTEIRPVRAQSECRALARAICDFRQDTGAWPRNEAGEPDLKPLLGENESLKPALRAAHGATGPNGLDDRATGPGAGHRWLREVPLDPWGNPYRVILGDKAVAVLSPGPDHKPDTDESRLWVRPANIDPCDGDDVGFVLALETDGEAR